MRSAPICPAESLSLAQLRRRQGLSQLLLADEMSVSQPQIARLEGRDDLRIASLRRYIAALGGELELIAHIDGEEISLRLGGDENCKPFMPNHQPTSGRTPC